MAESKISLKVGIYPYIPDLNGDELKGLREFIKREFEKLHPDIDLTVNSKWKPYDVKQVSGYLSSDANSFDIVEMDTILLGEVVDEGVVQQLDLDKFDLDNVFFPVALDGVTYKGNCFGVPTLNCGNFLTEVISGDVPASEPEVLCSLEKGDHSEADLKRLVRCYHSLFKGVSSLVGDFRGKWDEVKDIAESDHIMMYGFSEWLSQVLADKLAKKKKIHASCIVSPPLGANNYLLTFTDALVVNKSQFAKQDKALAITKFIKFYSSLKFRNQYAEGIDLKEPHPPRYVLISRKDFYTDGFGAENKHYRQLHEALKSAVACPNHGMVGRHEEMNDMLVKMLHLPPSP